MTQRKVSDPVVEAAEKLPPEYMECRGILHPYIDLRFAEKNGIITWVKRCPNCETTVTAVINARTGQYLQRPERTGTRPDFHVRGYGQQATSTVRNVARLAVVRQRMAGRL